MNICYDLNNFKNENDAKNVAIMLESRFNGDIVKVLLNFSRFLCSDWHIRLYVIEEVFDKYQMVVSNLKNNIHVLKLNYPLENKLDYNSIMYNLDFWLSLQKFDKVLIFQSDTCLYKYGIEQFLDFDYIGAPWPDFLGLDVGNGGLSLRSIKGMIESIKNKDTIKIEYNLTIQMINKKIFKGQEPEDVFFSCAFKQLGYKVANREAAQLFSNESCYFNPKCIGSHQLEKFNKQLHEKLMAYSILPFENVCSKRQDIQFHRHGWKNVDNYLEILSNKISGTILSTLGDCYYVFDEFGTKTIGKDWVGIFHLTPVSVENHKKCDINILRKDKRFLEDLLFCKGIFTLSKHSKKFVESMLSDLGHKEITVESIKHPVQIDTMKFIPESILNDEKRLLFIGSQLRRLVPFFKLQTNYCKFWLPGRTYESSMKSLFMECIEHQVMLTKDEFKSVDVINLDVNEYDAYLCCSIAIIDLYDASANNTVLECISHTTPLFVNKLPAVVEYLGENYPLYYETFDQVEQMLQNDALLLQAHKYLKNMNKDDITINYFLNSIYNSKISRQLLTLQI